MTRVVLQESSSCCGGDEEAVDQLVAATTPASQLQMDYTMNQLWNDIAAAEADTSYDAAAAMASPPSPVWEFRGGVRGPRRRRRPAAATAAAGHLLLLFAGERRGREKRGDGGRGWS
uniref:Uncharacterized protein n=1 Tax=Oryza rufipogon TaxID=4529 RepID=A0A0E0QKV5_ORYRU